MDAMTSLAAHTFARIAAPASMKIGFTFMGNTSHSVTALNAEKRSKFSLVVN